jgi:hypothetical protein
MLRLARTLGQKLSHFAAGITEQEQDVLLKRLYFGQAETVQAATASGLITIGTEADKPVEPVFLMDPSLVATHNNLHQSLHQSNEQSQPPSRHGMYTQTCQMHALARAIDNNQCEKDKDPSMPKWERFLGSAPASDDHACQPSMGMFTNSGDKFEGFPSYVIPDLNSRYWAQVSDNPKEKDYRESCLKGYDKQLGQVNSKLRHYLSNIILVDMVSQYHVWQCNPTDKKTDEALEALKVPTTLPDFLAWKKREDSQTSNAKGWHPKLSTWVGSAQSSEESRHGSGVETLG